MELALVDGVCRQLPRRGAQRGNSRRPKVISRINAYLRIALATSFDSGGMNRFDRRRNKLVFAGNVAAVDYLRHAGEPDTARETALLRVSAGMMWEDRLRLAEMISVRPDLRPQAEAILDGAWKAVTVVGRRVDIPDSAFSVREFPSRVAPAARLLTATLALRPTHPLLAALNETVLQQGRAESAIAWSTQDYASVVLALAGFADVDPVDRPLRARVAGSTFVARRPATGVDSSIVVPLTGLLENGPGGRPQLRVHLDASEANKTIYFALEVDEVPLAPPVKPDIQGIVVERWYERFSDGTPVTTVQEGDLVACDCASRFRPTDSSSRSRIRCPPGSSRSTSISRRRRRSTLSRHHRARPHDCRATPTNRGRSFNRGYTAPGTRGSGLPGSTRSYAMIA